MIRENDGIKSWLFENISTIHKLIARLTKKKEKMARIVKIKNKTENHYQLFSNKRIIRKLHE
jgi:hypothetical protein